MKFFFFFTGRKSPFLVCGKYLTTSVINRFNVIAATEILKANKPNRDEWICYNDFIRDFKKFALYLQFVVRKNWLNSVKMVCSLSVRGHHSYHFNLLTYVVLFCSFLLNSVHRCCQDFPLYISDRFVPGLAPRLFRREPL